VDAATSVAERQARQRVRRHHLNNFSGEEKFYACRKQAGMPQRIRGVTIKNKMKASRILLYGFLLFAICNMLSGCATVPSKGSVPAYTIKGVTYLPLVSLCNSKNIAWSYDDYSRTFTLVRDMHKINLRVGDHTVLVDGRLQNLRYPVDIYQGITVVPYRFKEQVIDVLFKEPSSAIKPKVSLARIKKVVIDPGHGGVDPGAIGRTGLKEKDVNLDIAKRLRSLLIKEGVEVVMTRSTDTFVSLPSRVAITNRSKADLFISIHANANRVRSVNGFEVYYVSTAVGDSKRATAAARNIALNIDKGCFGGNSLSLRTTLWDMIYTYNRAESIELGRSICSAIESDSNARVIGVKGAKFYVLKGSCIPAVLVEVGFLSNTAEERKLRNGYYRQEMAEGILQGLRRYVQNYKIMEASR